MNINNFIQNTNKTLNNYGIISELSISKRNKLVDLSSDINKILKQTRLQSSETKELLSLYKITLEKISGHWLTNLFLKIFHHQQFKNLETTFSENFENLKRMEKLQNLHLSTDQCKPFYEVMFNDHIYERMKFYGHEVVNTPDGDPTFRYVERKKLKEFATELSDKNTFREKLIQDKASFEIRQTAAVNRYTQVEVSKLSESEFNQLINERHDEIEVIYPQEFLTIEQMVNRNILCVVPDKKGEYTVYHPWDKYQYLDCGFTKIDQSKWDHLHPYNHIKNPPRQYVVDIISFGYKGELPNALDKPCHSAVRITTPGGEVYSIGMVAGDNNPGDFSLMQAEIVSPDPETYFPLTIATEFKRSYLLPNEEAFHRLIKYIESLQGFHENEKGEIKTCNILYHCTKQNCAAFAGSIRDFAINKLGAKPANNINLKLSGLKKLEIKLQKFLVNTLCFLFGKTQHIDRGIEIEDMKNFNIKDLNTRGLYLPIDLLR